jgi:hypothetical protein
VVASLFVAWERTDQWLDEYILLCLRLPSSTLPTDVTSGCGPLIHYHISHVFMPCCAICGMSSLHIVVLSHAPHISSLSTPDGMYLMSAWSKHPQPLLMSSLAPHLEMASIPRVIIPLGDAQCGPHLDACITQHIHTMCRRCIRAVVVVADVVRLRVSSMDK